jgi:hypothetical protein
METLNLSTPEQHDFADPTVERDVERLRVRLSNLPLMDVVETVRQVHSGLEALNEQKIDTGLRFELLQVYRDTVQRLFVTVDPLHLRQLSLSRTQREQATKGVEQLLLGMAGGYKVIVMDYYAAASMQMTGRVFSLAVHHALEQLGYVLLDCYRFYRSVQDNVFSELHQLYRLARHNGLLEVAADTGVEHEPPLSTAATYHTALLLSLSDPFRLAEGEVGLLHDVLKQHATSCRVIPGNSWSGRPEGLFYVDLKGSSPPKTCMRLESPVSGEEPFLLDRKSPTRGKPVRSVIPTAAGSSCCLDSSISMRTRSRSPVRVPGPVSLTAAPVQKRLHPVVFSIPVLAACAWPGMTAPPVMHG